MTTSASSTPTTSLPAGRAGPLAAHARGVGLRLRDRLDRALGERRSARASLDGRLHREPLTGITAREHPEILGDVFAWNKLFRTSFWRAQGLEWPEGVRYEDQPTTTRAFLAGTFDVVPEVVYHWRIRQDGSSITQQRASTTDLRDRWRTKRMALDAVQEYDDPATSAYFVDRVMAGDLHRYFVEIPGASDEWWRLLVDGIHDLWGERSLVHSGLPPVHRLVGWLVEQDRRADAESVVRWLATLDGPAPRDGDHLVVPPSVLDVSGGRPRRAGAPRLRAVTRWLRRDEVPSRSRRTERSYLTGSRDGR